MNYFINVAGHTPNAGSQDNDPTASFVSLKGLQVKLGYPPLFFPAEEISGETAIGTELYLTAVYGPRELERVRSRQLDLSDDRFQLLIEDGGNEQ